MDPEPENPTADQQTPASEPPFQPPAAAESNPAETEADPHVFEELGDVLFAAVNVARRLNVDPELELRAATARFRARVEGAEKLAEADGLAWRELPLDEQDAYFDRAKETA